MNITNQIAFASLTVVAVAGSLVTAKGQETHTQLPGEKPQTARVANPPSPKVELNFTALGRTNWSGKRFSDIIPPNKIQRIICVNKHSFPRFGKEGFAAQKARQQGDNDAFNAAYREAEQASYDSFIASMIASTEKATEWGLGANEHPLAELMVLTTDYQLFRIEILKSPIRNESGALLIYGQGTSARIEVRNSQFIESRD